MAFGFQGDFGMFGDNPLVNAPLQPQPLTQPAASLPAPDPWGGQGGIRAAQPPTSIPVTPPVGKTNRPPPTRTQEPIAPIKPLLPPTSPMPASNNSTPALPKAPSVFDALDRAREGFGKFFPAAAQQQVAQPEAAPLSGGQGGPPPWLMQMLERASGEGDFDPAQDPFGEQEDIFNFKRLSSGQRLNPGSLPQVPASPPTGDRSPTLPTPKRPEGHPIQPRNLGPKASKFSTLFSKGDSGPNPFFFL